MADRVTAARAEIARRRALAEAATPGEWVLTRGGSVYAQATAGVLGVAVPAGIGAADAAFIAANDPSHVLRVLDAAEKVLDRHAPVRSVADGHIFGCSTCIDPGPYEDYSDWPCAEITPVLDLYAGEQP